MFLDLISSSRPDYQYHPVSINEPDPLEDGNIDQVPGIGDHIINIYDIFNPKIFDVTDIDFRIAEFLKTSDLTRFFNISKGMQTTLSELPQVNQILLYNRFVEVRKWELLANYPYENFIRRKQIKVRGLISSHIENKSNAIKQFKSIEKDDQLLATTGSIPIFMMPFLLITHVSGIRKRTENICQSIFNTTSCQPMITLSDDGIRNVDDFMKMNNFTQTLSIVEEKQIYNLIDYSYSNSLLFLFYLFNSMIVNMSISYLIERKVHPLGGYYFTPKEKNILILAVCSLILFQPSFYFYLSNLKNSYMDVEDISYTRFFLDDFDGNKLFSKFYSVYLTNIYLLGCYACINKPLTKITNNISNKIKNAYNNTICSKPQLIKVMAQNALTKIKTTFQSIGSFFARISAPHVHNL